MAPPALDSPRVDNELDETNKYNSKEDNINILADPLPAPISDKLDHEGSDSGLSIDELGQSANESKVESSTIFDLDHGNRYTVTGSADQRDPTWLILNVQPQGQGEPLQVWTKADTGADANFISLDLLKKLGMENEERRQSRHKFEDIEGNPLQAHGLVTLEFSAGFKGQRFREDFEVLEHDEVALLLGRKVLFERMHAISIDPEYDVLQHPEFDVSKAWGQRPVETPVFLTRGLGKKFFNPRPSIPSETPYFGGYSR